ncbi:DUF3048 domain-containing protein [Candidatus Microgenomates bacterium]|nr:DUF3048 domain-containing protein [Candidatus Microgenomates bacterium]
MRKILVVGGLVVYLLSAGLSYAAFSLLRPNLPGAGVTPAAPAAKTGQFKTPTNPYANLPKTQACPLNGAMYSQPEKDNWSKRRPLGVMIENSKAARPQSGLSAADVVYEAVAEGGITRFMAVFYCQDTDIVGPVRSARTYFLDWISEYGSSPLYAHVGGANTPGPADALGQIERYGWGAFNDLNQFSVGFPTFWRDYERLGPDTATEHTVYSATSKLWSFAAAKRGLTDVEIDDYTKKPVAWDKTFVPWVFKDDAAVADRPAAGSTEFALSGLAASYANDYVVRWQYDHDSNAYLRLSGGVAHQDLDTKQQLLAKNVVLLFTTLGVADDGYNEEGHGAHMLYGTRGTGKAQFLIDGKVTSGTWSKATRIARTKFFDSKGVEIKFNRGQIWVEILPIGQTVKTQ